MNKLAIEINNLNKSFRNILAVKNINFKIYKGTIIGLLGPNGCGKINNDRHDVRFNKTHFRNSYYQWSKY